VPGLSHADIVPTLWVILHQIEADWRELAMSYVYEGPDDDRDARSSFCFDTYEALRPRYVQCLFSYISFFYLLENGFTVLYDELKDLAFTLNLRFKMPRKPKRPEYIKKLRRVRNHTVVHWGGPDKKSHLNSRAGRMWGFSWDAQANDLVHLCFGNMSVVGAEDRTLLSIPETHAISAAYLREWDEAAHFVLATILEHLPLTVGTRQYTAGRARDDHEV
jgi:hypothetical protein